MVFGSKLVICVIFTFVQFVRSDTVFSNQYLGNYLSDKEYKSREKCSTKVCLLDADRLIYAATRNSSIKPCDDFKTFAMGEFYLHRKKNDRYPLLGFYPETHHLERERYRNVLNLPIKKDDLKVHKFLKSHFKKCADLDHITKHGGDEVLAYLNALGGSPLIANETWNETKFDVTTLLQSDSHAFFYLTDIQTGRCKINLNTGSHIIAIEPICLTTGPGSRLDKIEMLKVFHKFEFDKIKQQKAIEDYDELVKIRNSDDKKNKDTEHIIKIKDLSSTFPHFNINWLKFINDRLLSTSQITEDEAILIEDPDYLNQTLTFLSTMDKGVIANAFIVSFLVHRNSKLYGTKQGRQRFQTCIEFYRTLSFKLALDSLLANKKFNKEIQNAAKEFVGEAVADHASEIGEQQTFNDEQKLLKEELIEKLKNVKLQVMFLDEQLNDSIVEKLYDGLEFEETMSFFELQLAMESFRGKALTEGKSSFFRTVNSKVVQNVEYFIEENILVVPPQYAQPPIFVTNRSRFFNVATLHTVVHNMLSIGIGKYLESRNKLDVFPIFLDHFRLADKYYNKWEENGGKELQLSPFKLTNRQMLWLCMANVLALQYHSKINESYVGGGKVLNDNYNISFKGRKCFREAFQCEDDEATQEQEDMVRILWGDDATK